MSHVSVINKVPVKDLTALEAAVDELRENGTSIRLVAGKGPRLYDQNQTRAYENCAYTIELPDARYDIGVSEVKNEEGNFVRYDLITDFWDGSVANNVGHVQQNGEEYKDGFKMGKLMKAYTKYAIHNYALQQGKELSEMIVADNGEIHIKLKVAA